jgi:hypothetical protein
MGNQNHNLTRAILICACLLLQLVVAYGQTQSRLTGTVTDSSGAVIPGAKIELRNAGTGVVQTALTSPAGTYDFPTVPPGVYELRCQAEGFKSYTRSGIVLDTGFSRSVNIEMAVGNMAESVTVTAAPPLLESTTSSVGQFVTREAIDSLPLATRRAGNLVRLLGNVSYNPSSDQIPLMSVAGGRSRVQMYVVDGASAQNQNGDVPQMNIAMPADAMQEFKLEQNKYSAEFGRSAGGVILMSTRSGGNDLHWSVFDFLRNEVLDTRTFFAADKAPLRYNIFGATVGGPIKRNKAFFFANYEGHRRRDGFTFSGGVVPREQEVQGDFSLRKDLTLKDPVGGAPFPGNVIPKSRLDPVGAAVAQLYPRPNAPSDPSTAARANYIENVADPYTWDQITAKVDYNHTDNHRFYGRAVLPWFEFGPAPVFPEATKFADPRAGVRTGRTPNMMGAWIYSISPTLLQEFRVAFEPRLFQNQGLGAGSGVNGKLGVKGVSEADFGRFNVAGYTNLGLNLNSRQSPVRALQFSDQYTWIRGGHSLRFGFEYRYSAFTQEDRGVAGGLFGFGQRATGDGLAELLLGHVNAGSFSSIPPITTRTDYYAAYLQDDWKVTPALTLNVGLRWEMDTPIWEPDNRQNGFDATALNPVCNCPGVVTFAGRDGQSKYAHDFDALSFGPRAGFAWQVSGSLVVRGGYGIAYNPAYPFGSAARFNLGFAESGSFASPDGGLTPAFVLAKGMPSVASQPLGPGFGAVPLGQSPQTAVPFLARDHVPGYAQQWNFGAQNSLPFQMLFEANYQANVGHKLAGPPLSRNMIPLVDGQGPARQAQALRPFPQFTDVIQHNPAFGNSSYHALNLKLEKRYSAGLNFLMNYTWSKFLDDVSALSEIGGSGGYQHIELRRLDKSYSGSDIRHRFVVGTVYELPFGRGKSMSFQSGMLNHLAGGWSLGLLAEARTGLAYGVVATPNTSNTFSSAQRANILGTPEQLSGWRENVIGTTFFDRALFQAPPAGTFGNAARHVGFGPGFLGIDASVHKWWNLTERLKLQYRADFYNLPNHASFEEPSGALGTGSFGYVTGILPGSTGRMIQMSLRLEY